MASAGAACHASAKTVNPALLALGLDVEEARCVLRFSIGRSTTREDVEAGLGIIREVSSQLAAVSS